MTRLLADVLILKCVEQVFDSSGFAFKFLIFFGIRQYKSSSDVLLSVDLLTGSVSLSWADLK